MKEKMMKEKVMRENEEKENHEKWEIKGENNTHNMFIF